jgi:hypothetical protein
MRDALRTQEDVVKQNNIYLRLGKFAKSFTDADGNYIFDVEASNENLDLEGEHTLQRALLSSKDYFLTNGVISKDHLHQEVIPEADGGGIKYHEEYIIGEPLEVYTDGASTHVKGKLYKDNKYAQRFINLLKDHSTRVKASVGGLVPQRVANADGTTSVVSVLWNDLALTVGAVNPTVAPAALAKSLSSAEFVKALTAGSGTDSALFTGGRALQTEDVEGHPTDVGRVTSGAAIASLVGALTDGRITNLNEALQFLAGYGIAENEAREIISAIVAQKKQFREVLPMAKGNLWDNLINGLEKSLGKKKHKEEDEVNLDDEPIDDGEDEGEEPIDDGGENEDDDGFVDAGPALKSISMQVKSVQESNEVLAKALTSLVAQSESSTALQKAMGESLLAVMKGQRQLGVTPQPRKSAVSALDAMMKGGGVPYGGAGDAGVFEEMRDKLDKALADKRISMQDYSLAETQLQKSLSDPSFQMDGRIAALLSA